MSNMQPTQRHTVLMWLRSLITHLSNTDTPATRSATERRSCLHHDQPAQEEATHVCRGKLMCCSSQVCRWPKLREVRLWPVRPGSRSRPPGTKQRLRGKHDANRMNISERTLKSLLPQSRLTDSLMDHMELHHWYWWFDWKLWNIRQSVNVWWTDTCNNSSPAL